MGNVVSATNVVSQIGIESGGPGTGGAAGTKLKSLKIEPGDELTIRDVMAQGHRFDTGTVIDKRWTSLAVSSDTLLYTEHLYCLENIFGAATLTSPGTLTKKRVYTPAIVGSITPNTWTHQWGDPGDNVNQYAYGLLTGYGETFDRESGVKMNGAKGVAQIVSTGNTFTATPKALAEVPIGAADFNLYLDGTWAGLGTTQITDEIETVDWSLDGIKAERWAANRSRASFSGHVDVKPKTSVKFTIYEGTVARPIIAALEAGGRYFLRIDAQSPLYIDNYFVVTLGSPTAGTFTLTYKAQTTAGIAFNATAAAVQSAFTALSTVGAGNATVTGGTGGPYTITLAGTLANDPTAITGSGSGLTGGTFGVVATQFPYLARRDFSLLCAKVSPLGNVKDVYGRQVEFSIQEDPTSGNAMQLTSYTAEATL